MVPGRGIPDRCELCPFIDALEWREPFEREMLSKLDPHHVYSRSLDEPCGVVSACRSCHDWVHRNPKAGLFICTEVLIRSGRFDIDKAREAYGKDPRGAVSESMAKLILSRHDLQGFQ